MIYCDYNAYDHAAVYHIRFCTEKSVSEALWGHPFEWQFNGVCFALPVVTSGIDILS